MENTPRRVRSCTEKFGYEHRPEGWYRGHDQPHPECPDCDKALSQSERAEAAK